ncbi:MAG: PAS domain S-box protein, partial [Syntrophobacteraceae bacterium]
PPEWLPIEQLKLEELHLTDKPVRYEKEYIRKDGSRVPVELLVHLVTDSVGAPQYYYSFLTDITERKRAEEALSLRESYLTAILENQPGLVWLKDKESRFLAVNQAFARSCGMERPEEVLGKTYLDIWPRELAEKYRNGFAAPLPMLPSPLP